MKVLNLFLYIWFWCWSCRSEEAKFYIYEWDKALDDVYPPPGATLHPKSAYDHSFYENNGLGKMLVPDIGLFQTWQFSLYKNVMNRLRASPKRTRDPTKAAAFIIPFDAGVHSYIDHENGKPRLASPHGWRAISLLDYHRKNETFWKLHGHNHFVFFSITVYQMVGIGVKVFFMEKCQNCTAITIETSPTYTAISGRSRKYWFAAPYPSSFHWWEGIKTLPWEASSASASQRDILALFIGSVKTSSVNSNLFRKTLFAHCKDDARCQWHPTAHACNGVVNSTSQMLLFRKAQYCPAPPGDSITRKSIFDALIAGCIPVIFARASMSQYLWYFTKEEMAQVAVYIPKQAIMENGTNFLDFLRAIPPSELRSKQLLIEKLASRWQYSMVPNHINAERGDTWESPVHDAADVIMDKILDRRTIEPVNGFQDMELIQQKCLQNDIMQNHADYAGLFPGKTKGDAGSNIAGRIWNKNKCQNYSREAGFHTPSFAIDW